MEENQPNPEPALEKKSSSLPRLLLFLFLLVIIVVAIVFVIQNLPAEEPEPLSDPSEQSSIEEAATRALPPTFTPAPTEVVFTPTPPVIEPTEPYTATPTFITLPTKPDVTAEPTNPEETPAIEPTPTTDSNSLTVGCGIRANKDGVTIEVAPFIDPYHILPTMEPGVIYEVDLYHPTYYHVTRDGKPVGWVDYRLLALEHLGDDCGNVTTDETPITEFPDLCFFEALTDNAAYANPDLNGEAPTDLNTGTQMILMYETAMSYFATWSHAGPSFYVDKEQVKLFGDCHNIVRVADTTETTWLWTEPGGDQAEQSHFIVEGTSLYVQGDAINGQAPPGIEGEGDWYLVIAGRQSDGNIGWIWADYVELK